MRKPQISGRTKICGVIGDPIEHSMSPVMHNAAFAELGLDYVYVAFHVRPDGLEQAINGMRGLDITGLNVTIPHKVAVMALLDEIDPLARQIGAVNTITRRDGRLTGHNTDASGFLETLTEQGTDPAGKETVVLGAGGAARAVVFSLARSGAALTILNRREELDWAVNLARQVSEAFGREIPAQELTETNLEASLDGAEVVVNTTSVGMIPHPDATPLPARYLRGKPVVFDIVYNPEMTRLRREAEAAGCVTIGGLDMLVRQGAVAFEMWTGQRPPEAIMKREARRVLEGK